MNRKKPMTFIGMLKNHFVWLAVLFLVVSFAVTSLISVFESQADKDDAPGQVKKEGQEEEKKEKKKLQKKRLANVTIEREGYFIKNAGTPHAFVALKKKLIGERAPNLSASAIEGEVLEGTVVRYTITLKNKGNINATDIDVLNELDSRFSEPEHFVLKECGKRYKKSSEGNQVELSNILVKKDKNCVIQYDVTATANGTMGNWLYLSPAAEGGEEIGPIEAVGIKVRVTPEDKNAEPGEEEAIPDNTEETSDNTEGADSNPRQTDESQDASQDEEIAEKESIDTAEPSGDAEGAISQSRPEADDATGASQEEELSDNEDSIEEVAEPADGISSETAEAESL